MEVCRTVHLLHVSLQKSQIRIVIRVLGPLPTLPKISAKSIWTFLRNLADKQTSGLVNGQIARRRSELPTSGLLLLTEHVLSFVRAHRVCQVRELSGLSVNWAHAVSSYCRHGVNAWQCALIARHTQAVEANASRLNLLVDDVTS